MGTNKMPTCKLVGQRNCSAMPGGGGGRISLMKTMLRAEKR